MHEREVDVDLRVVSSGDGRDGLHRVVDASELNSSESVTRRRHGLLTGLSVIVAPEPSGEIQVDEAVRWAPPEFRVELVLGDPTPSLTERLDVLAWPWTAVGASDGRAAMLDAATSVSSGEFVIVTGAGPGSFERLEEALGLMWVNGADALVLLAGPAPSAERQDDVDPDDVADRRAERLGAALGLGLGRSRGLVVLRRWVARFLFDGIRHSIDPLHELGERVRLLELRLLEVAPRS